MFIDSFGWGGLLINSFGGGGFFIDSFEGGGLFIVVCALDGGDVGDNGSGNFFIDSFEGSGEPSCEGGGYVLYTEASERRQHNPIVETIMINNIYHFGCSFLGLVRLVYDYTKTLPGKARSSLNKIIGN